MRIEANLVEVDGTMKIMRIEGRSFDDWFNQEYGLAYRIAWRVVGNHDDAQDAVMKGIRGFLVSFDPGRGPARPWLLFKVRYAAQDILRQRAAMPLQLDAVFQAADPDPDWEIAFSKLINQIDRQRGRKSNKTVRAILELKIQRPTDYYIVSLRTRDGEDWPEISKRLMEEMGISLNADGVRKRCERACEYVRRRVEDENVHRRVEIPRERNTKRTRKEIRSKQ